MTYVSRPMGNRLGIHANTFEDIRDRRGLTPAGFQQDSTDAAGADKEAMEREMYRRADAHLPQGIGGAVPAPDLEAEGSEEDDEEAP